MDQLRNTDLKMVPIHFANLQLKLRYVLYNLMVPNLLFATVTTRYSYNSPYLTLLDLQ